MYSNVESICKQWEQYNGTYVFNVVTLLSAGSLYEVYTDLAVYYLHLNYLAYMSHFRGFFLLGLYMAIAW